MDDILFHKLKIARKIRGLSMESLSQKMNGLVTKQSISKYEQGKMKPSDVVLEVLAQALDMPLSYFFRQGVAIGSINFRVDSQMPAKLSSQMISVVQDKIENYLNIEELLMLPSEIYNPLDGMLVCSADDVEAAANELRIQWQLGGLPIFSVYDMLERHGIKLVEFEAGPSSILGFSGLVNDSIPLIVINLSLNHTSERKRFTAIHELGHLFLHFSDEIDDASRERYCHLFAGAVLCPASVIRKELGSVRRMFALDELVSLRNRYGISIAAVVHRAKDLGIITVSYYNEIFDNYIHSNRMEKGWGGFPIEEHTDRFERLVHRCIAEGYLTIEEAADYMKEKPQEYKRRLTLLC